MIRKYVLLAAALALSALPCSSMEIQVGGKLAGGFGFLKGDDWLPHSRSSITGQTTRMGWSGSVFVDFALHPNFSLQAGVGVSRFGNRYTYVTATESRFGVLTAHLLEVPLLVRPGFDAGRGRMYVFLGVSPMIFLDDMLLTEQSDVVSIVEEIRPDHRFLWGGTGGLGYSIGIGRGTALAELRYEKSLTPLFERSNTSLTGMWLVLGYSMPFHRPGARPAGSPASG